MCTKAPKKTFFPHLRTGSLDSSADPRLCVHYLRNQSPTVHVPVFPAFSYFPIHV